MSLRVVANRLRGSFLFLPALFVLGAVALSVLTGFVDRNVGFESWLFPGGAESARSLLTAIAGASMTLTGVVFSITMLVLQLASSQYSPRVLRTFLRDRLSQLALATFAATFTFSLASLREVVREAVPLTSVAVSFVLAVLTIALFVIYVNHISQRIRISSIVASIEAETHAAFDEVYRHPGNAHGDPAQWPSGQVTTIGAPRGGVVVAANVARLVAAARRFDVAVELVPPVGAFVAQGSPLLRVVGDEPPDADALTRHVALGDERDTTQDPAFGFRQLVDIAERALSPGTNDPTTAVEAVHALHNLLIGLADVEIPAGVAEDEEGVPRFRRRERTYSELLGLAVDEVLLYGSHSLQVLAALDDMLDDLLRVASGSRAEDVATKLEQVREVRRRLLAGDAWFAGAAGREYGRSSSSAS